jgi:phage tail tape-measure protein
MRPQKTYSEKFIMNDKKQDDAAKQKEENERAGSLAGVAGGALAGAQVGTVLMPVVGTFAGAVVGGVLGSKVGKKYGGALLDKFNNKESAETSSGDVKDVTAELERLANLREKGVLSEDEFRAAKAQLLGL